MNKIDEHKIIFDNKLSKEDITSNKQLIRLIYNTTLTFFFGNNESDKKDFTKIFNKNLNNINIQSTSMITCEDDQSKVYGYFDFAENGKANIYFGGINSNNNTSVKKICSNATHEIMHCFINNHIHYLNNENNEYRNGRAKYYLDEFGTIHCETGSKMFPADALYEATNEFLSCLVTDKIMTYKKNTFNQEVTSNLTSKDLKNSGYMELIPMIRLLAAAFNNDYESECHSITGHNSLLTRFIVAKDGNIIPSNSFIYNMVSNPVELPKEYDYYMGDGAFSKLAININQFLNYDVNKSDSDIYNLDNKIKNMMFQIAVLNRKRNAYMLSKGKIDEDQLVSLESTFNDTFMKTKNNYDIELNTNNVKEFDKVCNSITDNDSNIKKLRKVKIKEMRK